MFQFMGRKKFNQLLTTLVIKRIAGWTNFFLYGTIYHGKSHILAALAVCLLRTKRHVVYLPECSIMLLDPVPYQRKALFLCSHDNSNAQKNITQFSGSEDLFAFRDESVGLIFLVDQFNRPGRCDRFGETGLSQAH
eukprot:Rmarinus@m.22584